tara:strand:+ start:711 stop:923 length:213 start_codon:yes stop_codon:yes gene_type:complete
MKNKYKIGDLVWDKVFNEFGIIVEIICQVGCYESYRIRWTTGDIDESREVAEDISPHPTKNLLITERINF